MIKNLILTGRPGIGKTTVVRKVAERLGDRAVGFYTVEVRKAGRREGFDVVTLDGRRGILARRRLDSPHRVGRYRVDLAALEALLDELIPPAPEPGQVLIIDEIGKMELLSERFVATLMRALESPAPVIATMMRGQHPVVRRVLQRPDVRVVEVTMSNRDQLPEQILSWLIR